MAIDPPYRLDPFQNIVNVGWGGGVLVVVFEWEKEFSVPPSMNSPPGAFIGMPLAPPLDASLIAAIGPSFPPPDKRSDPYYSYAPWTNNSSGTETATFSVIDVGRYDIQTSLGVITEYSDSLAPSEHMVPFQIDWNSTVGVSGGSGGSDLVFGGAAPGFAAALAAHMQYVVDRTLIGASNIQPHLIEILASHTVTDTRTNYHYEGRTITFFNISALKSSTWAQANEGDPFPITFNFYGEDHRTFIDYTLNVSTWRGRSDFPVNAENAPAWGSDGLVSMDEYEAETEPEQATPPATKTALLNLDTLDISIS